MFKNIYFSSLRSSEVHNEIRGSRVLRSVGNYYETTRRHIPEECNLHAHPHGSLKLLNSQFLLIIYVVIMMNMVIILKIITNTQRYNSACAQLHFNICKKKGWN
jgi:hypothetical protein